MSKRIDYNLTNATTGYFGINTTSPSTRFQVSGSNEILSSFLSNSLSGNQNNSIAIGKALTLNNSTEIRYHHSSDGNTTNNLQIGPYNNSSSFLTIRNDGNIGIGTTAPTARMEVSSGDDRATVFVNGLGGGSGTQPALRVKMNAASSARNIIQLENVNGVVMIARDDGNVGIGTSNPESKLHVNGNVIVGEELKFKAPTGDPSPIIAARTVPSGQGSSNERTELILFHSNDGNNGSGVDTITLRAPGLRFQTYSDSTVNNIAQNEGANDRMYINPDGNVGIGTTSSSSKLSIVSNPSFEQVPEYALTSNSNDAFYKASASSSNSSAWLAFDRNSVNRWTTATFNYSGGNYNGSTSTNVDGNPVLGEWVQLEIVNGIIGISRFDINFAGVALLSNVNSVVLCGSNDNINFSLIISATIGLFGSTINITGFENTTFRFIRLIGLSTYGGGSNATVADIVMYGNINLSGRNNLLELGSGAQTTTKFIVKTDGNVGIGTTSPGYKLHVVGDIFASGEITSSSDVRMKTNIESIDMTEEKIEKIKNIRGVLFDRQSEVKQNLNHKHMGFVAQELEEAIPEVVYTDPETGYKSIAYGNMTAILLEYIKHLNNKIEKLETTVTELKNENS